MHKPAVHKRSTQKRAAPAESCSVVGDTGIEPVTSSVSGKRATAAPIARAGIGSGGPAAGAVKVPRKGADDGIRTRDIHLGKVVL